MQKLLEYVRAIFAALDLYLIPFFTVGFSVLVLMGFGLIDFPATVISPWTFIVTVVTGIALFMLGKRWNWIVQRANVLLEVRQEYKAEKAEFDAVVYFITAESNDALTTDVDYLNKVKRKYYAAKERFSELRSRRPDEAFT